MALQRRRVSTLLNDCNSDVGVSRGKMVSVNISSELCSHQVQHAPHL